MSEGTTTPSPYNLLDAEAIANPYLLYKRLRTEVPVYWHEGMQVWLISRYAEVTTLLRQRQFSSTLSSPSPDESEERRQIREIMTGLLLFNDPPDHTRLRRLLEKAFDPIAPQMRDRISRSANTLLDKVKGSGRMDVISDFADPLPFAVLSELLDLPIKDPMQFRQWAFHFALVTSNAPTTPELDRQILQDLLDMTDFFQKLIEQRRQQPKEDLISALVLVEDGGDKLSPQELLINSILMFVGGHAPTTSMLGNALLALCRHRDQMQKLQDDPTLIESAVEELLRYDCSLHWATRRVTEDIEVNGNLIRQGQIVLFGLGSGNHDEARFSDPDTLDITRTDNRHLAFGDGPHACIGVPLLRPQLQIAINTILGRFKGLRVETDNLEWLGAPVFRGLKSLPVTFAVS